MNTTMNNVEIDPQAQQLIAAAPLPTPNLLKRRRNVLFQFARFVSIGITMLKVIGASQKK